MKLLRIHAKHGFDQPLTQNNLSWSKAILIPGYADRCFE